jgi:hypothetical protein
VAVRTRSGEDLGQMTVENFIGRFHEEADAVGTA